MAVLMIQKKMRRVHFRLLCSMRYRSASMLFRSMSPHIHVVIFYGVAQIKLLTTGAWGSNYQITATTKRG
ncbi:hypothetical protein T06_8026, partial [Trichinella sp. T6]